MLTDTTTYHCCHQARFEHVFGADETEDRFALALEQFIPIVLDSGMQWCRGCRKLRSSKRVRRTILNSNTFDLSSHTLDLENRMFYRFSLLVGRHVRHFAAKHLKKHKLSTQQWLILTVIGRFAPLSPSELADHTSVGRDKISRIVDQLVEHGFVSRRTDEEDRRRVVLNLFAKGRRVCDELEIVARDIEVKVLDTMSKDERTSLQHLLSKIEDATAVALAE
jgi:DNA-binding MarR family transcriptional regulator